MKKIKVTMPVIFTALFFSMFLLGCPNDNSGSGNQDGGDPDNGNPTTVVVQGKVIILQAYGSSSDAAGASHSFVELYNKSDEELKLDGIGLYYADGTSVANDAAPNTATEDGAWKRISLDGKAIPAGGSFLILGPKQSPTAARYQIPDNYGDINDPDFSLSNRAFKVALIKSTAELTSQNPFTDGDSDQPVFGYIDMVGAANDYEGRDLIFGFETAPARNSASEAVRRGDLLDTDDNSSDFIAARYASTGAGAFSDEELEVRKPRNSSAGAWQPFAEPASEYDGLPPTTAGDASAHAGKLLILQIGASADDDNNISHSFVELYNAGASDINLSGITLQYAAGTKVADGAAKDGKWAKIDLTGTIGAGKSFLILGAKRSTSSNPALNITANSGDMNIAEFKLDNRAVKVALIQNANLLTVQNPFNMNSSGGKAAGYIDMIGVINDNTDKIFGWEGSAADAPSGTAPFRITKQVGVRRTSLTDTNVNKNDFATVTYASLSTAAIAIMRPKNSSNGTWDPLEEPAVVVGSSKLMILQIGAATDGNVSHSFVELYNNGTTAVNLSGYSLQYAEGTRNNPSATQDGAWAKIDLSGTIPPQQSFLILGDEGVGQTGNAALTLTASSGDMNQSFVISNRSFKVVLLSNTTLLTVQNPFDVGSGEKAAGYVDMVGAINTANEDRIFGFETNAITNLNKQTGQRRTSLTDTDDNAADFARATFAGASATDLEKLRPKNLAYGAWDPITGVKQ